MADKSISRFQRSNEVSRRGATATGSGGEPVRGDPLAELARLIGQDDPFNDLPRGRPRGAESHEPEGTSFPSPVRSGSGDWRKVAAAMPPFEPLHDEEQAFEPEAVFEEADLRERRASGETSDYMGSPEPEHSPPLDAPRFLARRHTDGEDVYSRYTQRDRTETAPFQHGYEEQQDKEADPENTADASYYDGDTPGPRDHYGYDDVPRSRGRNGLVTAVTLIGCAIVGTAGAYGYRTYYAGVTGSRTPPIIAAEATPTKIVSAVDSQPSKTLDRLGDQVQEHVVSREEQPLDLPSPPMAAPPRMVLPVPVAPSATPQPGPASAGARGGQQTTASITGSSGSAPTPGNVPEPKRIKTITIRSDGSDLGGPPINAKPPPSGPGTRQGAAPAAKSPPPSRGGSPLSLVPQGDAPEFPPQQPHERVAPASPSTPASQSHFASTPAPIGSGGYAVQLSSQRTEAEAQASFRALQAKFPDQLGSRSPMIRRADLGDKGIYYRALVGPFATSEEATRFCSTYKAVGGNCIVQKN
jgi:SPOR domain